MKKIIPATNRLTKIENRLTNARRITPFIEKSWRDSIPIRPGIYAIWPKRKNANAVYVGESSNLSERLSDLGNPANHTFAKKIKAKILAKSTKKVKAYIQENYLISFIPVLFGRAEAEEYLITHWATYVDNKFNEPIPRRWRCNT